MFEYHDGFTLALGYTTLESLNTVVSEVLREPLALDAAIELKPEGHRYANGRYALYAEGVDRDHSYLRVVLTEREDHREYRTTLRAARRGTSAAVSLGVTCEATTPAGFEATLAAFPAWWLAREFLAGLPDGTEVTTLGGKPLRTERIRSDRDLQKWARYVGNERRERCVVVVTEPFLPPYAEQAPVSVNRLAGLLRGRAHLVYLEQRFTRPWKEMLGEGLAVYNGALRVYAPASYVPTSTGYASLALLHPRLEVEDIAARRDDDSLHGWLFATVAVRQRDAFREASLPAYDDAEERAAAAAFDARHAAGLGSADSGDDEAGPSATPEIDAVALKRWYHDALDQLERAHDTEEELRRQVEALRLRLAEAGDEHEPDPPSPTLLEHLVDYLGDNPRVRVWSTALDSAEQIPKEGFNLQTVRRLLHAVDDYANKLGGADGPAIGADTYWYFKNRGLRYKAKESPTTMGMHGEDRMFRDGDRAREVQSHITINPNNADRCLQLYLAREPGGTTLDVVYFGRHLPTATQTFNN